MSEDLAWQIDELRSELRRATEHITALELAGYKQQQQIDLLQGQLRKVYGQMRAAGLNESGGAALSADPRDDIPPHY